MYYLNHYYKYIIKYNYIYLSIKQLKEITCINMGYETRSRDQ